MAAALAGIGHNSAGAAPTPYDLSCDEIDSLFAEARNWADGSGIQSQAEADAVATLLDMIGDAIKTAEDRRKEEKRPHDEAAAEVQDRYNPLIGKTKAVIGKAILAQDACRSVLTPWRVRQEEERRAVAEAARKAAEEAQREAAFAFDITRHDDLEGRQRAEELAAEAKAAETVAKRAGKPTATGLRTTYRAEVTDFTAFARWAWTERPDEMRGLLRTLADRLCDAKVRGIPGVTITESKVAR